MDQVQAETKPEVKIVQEQNVTNPPVEAAAPVESDQEKNWKKFREARDLERKQAEEMSKRAAEKEAESAALRAALEAIVNKPQQQQNNNYDEEETEDQRIEKKVNQLLAQREAQSEVKRREQEQFELPTKLKTVHRDFDNICSASNLDYLDYHHPELAKSLGKQPESFDKWNDIYNAIKRYVPNPDSRKEQVKAEANFTKPQSISSPSISNPGHAVGSHILSEDRRAANWARMQKSMKGVG